MTSRTCRVNYGSMVGNAVPRECRTCLHGNDGQERASRIPGEPFAQCCVFGGGACMFWGGMTTEAKTERVFVTGPNTGHQLSELISKYYIEKNMEEYVRPCLVFIGENFVFMRDGVRPRTAAVVRPFLDKVYMLFATWLEAQLSILLSVYETS
ncbi:hypothetical protein GQX74_008796 [Glossina fuscipes]|nr:hypothetical protein GQX74_008796 [Glossina fuscipes]